MEGAGHSRKGFAANADSSEDDGPAFSSATRDPVLLLLLRSMRGMVVQPQTGAIAVACRLQPHRPSPVKAAVLHFPHLLVFVSQISFFPPRV